MRETGPLRVWAYARTADPAPHALEEQLAGLCRETARRGYQLINCGMDACRPNCLHRPALFTMMKAVREHQVDAVMVTRLSRISYSGRWMFYFLCFLQDNGDAEFDQLGGQVEVTLDVGAVDDVQDGVGLLIDEVAAGNDLLQRVGRQRVDTGQVLDHDVVVTLELALLLLNGNAGPVADILVRTGQAVEQGGFTAVRVACQSNFNCHLVKPLSLLFQNSLNFDHSGVSLADAELVVADGQLHRVAQRCDLADVNLGALGQAHVHDAALDRALAVQLGNGDGLADLCIFQSFHTLFLLLGTINRTAQRLWIQKNYATITRMARVLSSAMRASLT